MKKNMIDITKIDKSDPYIIFEKYYNMALDKGQSNVEAIAISSYDIYNKQVDSRFVNLKYIIEQDWYFFSNYEGPKSNQFKNHSQISILIYWSTINVQIRMKAIVEKCDGLFSDTHFLKRSKEKNTISIISNQSQKIKNFEIFKKRFKKKLKDEKGAVKRPDYWGGYKFKPFIIEFWQGNDFRLNKRSVYENVNKVWQKYYLEP